jgi:hypothetical protein
MLSKELQETIADPLWVKENESKLKGIFPETWTHLSNINPMQLMYQSKLVGIPWRSEQELATILAFLTKIGIVEVKDMLARRNPNPFLPNLNPVKT